MLPAKLIHPFFDASFYGRVGRTARGGDSYQYLPSIKGAQGLWLWCPCGYGKAAEHSHGLLIPFANPRNAPPCHASHGPVSGDGRHPRWTMSGTGLGDLTLSPSVNVGKDSCWHGHIVNGEVT